MQQLPVPAAAHCSAGSSVSHGQLEQGTCGSTAASAATLFEQAPKRHLRAAAGTHDVLRIQLLPPPAQEQQQQEAEEGSSGPAGPKYVLLPFAKELVPVVDLAAGRMDITPPEGLLELATSPAPKQERRENRGRRERRRGGGRGAAAAGSEEAASSGEDGGQLAAASGPEE